MKTECDVRRGGADCPSSSGLSAKRRYLAMCEDKWFGLFDRSEAAKKGWRTRKANGWDPKVGLSESWSKSPIGSGSAVQTPAPVVREERLSDEERIDRARAEYDRTKSAEAQRVLMDYMSGELERNRFR